MGVAGQLKMWAATKKLAMEVRMLRSMNLWSATARRAQLLLCCICLSGDSYTAS
jgi:hypothetical protein